MLKKTITPKLTSFLLLASCLLFVMCIEPKGYSLSYPSSTKTYTKKAPYAGYGKQSKVNGMIKTKPVSGHYKKSSKGYTYVNPYARSK